MPPVTASEHPQRVAYLVNIYPKVSHSFIRREILALERQGVEVERFALRGWDEDLVDPDDIAELGRTRHTLKGGMGGLAKAMASVARQTPGAFWTAFRAALKFSRKALQPLPYHLIYLGHACQLWLWLKDNPVDHLHAHFGTNSAEVAYLLKMLGGPDYSFTVHWGSAEADTSRLLHLPEKAKAATSMVAISHYTRSQLLREIPTSEWDKVKVVHCGLTDGFFADKTPPLPNTPIFLCVGRIGNEKGHMVMVAAFAKLLEKHPEARLVLAGDGPSRADVEARIAELGIGHAVRVTGWISSTQVKEELAGASAFVLPSFVEGLPVVIMEAMAMRRPVISTYVAGIPELVLPGETGWLVPASDVDALVDAMEAFIGTSAKALEAMVDKGQVRVRERHLIDTEAAKLKELFFDGA